MRPRKPKREAEDRANSPDTSPNDERDDQDAMPPPSEHALSEARETPDRGAKREGKPAGEY